MHPAISLLFSVILVVSSWADAAWAQQVQSATRFVGARESFYEYTGVGWSFRGPRFFARFGGLGQGRSAFAGFRPTAGLSSGWSVRSGPYSGRFRFSAVQGLHRSRVSSSTVFNGLSGYPATLIDATVAPYVFGMVPARGFYNVPPRIPFRVPSRIDLWRAARYQSRVDSRRQESVPRAQPDPASLRPLNFAGEAFRQLGGK